MANFKDWALQYVLADDEPVQLEIAKKAAKGASTNMPPENRYADSLSRD